MFSSPKPDNRYFISIRQYNCPYCSTASVRYRVIEYGEFDWSNSRTVYYIKVQCAEPSCQKVSLHLSDYDLSYDEDGDLVTPWVKVTDKESGQERSHKWHNVYEVDDLFFYHQPNSSFAIDDRIPDKLRTALDEANTCHKMSLSIGASASLRKTIFELLVTFNVPKTRKKENGDIEKIPYLERLDILKDTVLAKYPNVEPSLLDNIKKIYSLVSSPLHERLPDEVEWEDFSNDQFQFLMGVVHALLIQIFVDPKEKENRNSLLGELAKKVPGLK